VERLLKPLSDVRPGEGPRALLMLTSLLLLMLCYYILKTVREPLILVGGGAELKAYGSAVQVAAFFVWVPVYAWLTSRVGRVGLIAGLNGIFLVCLQLFYVGVKTDVPLIGFAFFAWLGLFSMSAVSQFWSVANDLYSDEAGKRIFPIIAIGAAVGSPLGSWIARWLFSAKTRPETMIQIACALLVAHTALSLWIAGRARSVGGRSAQAPIERGGSLQLIFRSSYLRLIASFLIILSLVNTMGEFLLSKQVEVAAEAVADKVAFIGSFYGGFYTGVNIASMVLQAFAVSRIVRYLGMRGVVLMLPVVALGTYGMIAAGVGLAVTQWLKTAENATDYSVMNTGRALLWLPTSRAEKYKAKQTVDTFFVRFGDLITAGLVFVGSTWLGFGVASFALINIVLIAVWLVIAWRLLAWHRTLTSQAAESGT